MGDGLLIANVHQHPVKQRQLGTLGRYGDARLRRQCRQAHGLKRDGFAAGVRPADDQNRLVAAQGQRYGDNSPASAAEFVFEHRMTRSFQFQFAFLLGTRGELRQRTVELAGEARARKRGVEFGDGRRGKLDWPKLHPEALGKFREDARDFCGLLFGQLDKPVVELNRFERFDEHGLAGGTRPVDHALHLTAVGGTHRDHEAVVAQGDVVFAGLFATRAQNLPQRFLDGVARAIDIRPDAFELARSVVTDFAVGQDGASYRSNQGAQVCKRRSARGQQRKLRGVVPEALLQPHHGIEQRRSIEEFRGREHGAGRLELRKPLLGVGERSKA